MTQGFGSLVKSVVMVMIAVCAAKPLTAAPPEEGMRFDPRGTIHVPTIALPDSALLSDESRTQLAEGRKRLQAVMPQTAKCNDNQGTNPADLSAIKQCELDVFYASPNYKNLRARYAVKLTPTEIGAVHTEVFEPSSGIAPENGKRVLINVHGGGFLGGSRTESHWESIPIAVLGRIKVVSIDYRLGPDHVFPAASEDVAAVYRELLKTYKPSQIGIYGHSAGGMLTAQSMAWFIKEKLPLPAAIGMFGDGAAYWTEGDSGFFVPNRPTDYFGKGDENPYLKPARVDDPLAYPIRSRELLAKFPPSVLISATRDLGLSSVVNTHSKLIALGRESDLHVWEGLRHGFFDDPELPESREAYDVIVKFFAKHLAK